MKMHTRSSRSNWSVLCAVLASALAACSGPELDDLRDDTPLFDFEGYFEGHTRASGWFSDRAGVPQRHFCGDFVGSYDGDDFVLDERLFYTDGVIEDRVWRVRIDDNGVFVARSDTLVGDARGQVRGNGLQMRYTMVIAVADGAEYQLDFNDFMLLQPDGSLHNITRVKKLGVRLGTVTTQYAHHDGSEGCEVRASELAAR